MSKLADELEVLESIATPGPWEFWASNPWHADAPNHPLRDGNPPTVFRTGDSGSGSFYKEEAQQQATNDTIFICRLRELLPAIIEELRQ